jgi:hypothetical protein
VLKPLCATAERWKAGELAIADMADALEDVNEHACELRNLFSQRDDRLVLLIQGLDREWFENWLKDHSPPPGARLISPLE